jgi:hypothetical protein
MDMPDFCASEAGFFSAEAMRVNRYVWPRSNLGPKVLQVLHDRFHSLAPYLCIDDGVPTPVLNGSLRAIQLARRGRFRRQAIVRNALSVRRTP